MDSRWGGDAVLGGSDGHLLPLRAGCGAGDLPENLGDVAEQTARLGGLALSCNVGASWEGDPSLSTRGKGAGGLGTRAGASGVSSVKDTGAGRGTHRDFLHGTAHLRGRCGARRDDVSSGYARPKFTNRDKRNPRNPGPARADWLKVRPPFSNYGQVSTAGFSFRPSSPGYLHEHARRSVPRHARPRLREVDPHVLQPQRLVHQRPGLRGVNHG